MAVQVWESLKESITAYTGLSPATFFTAIAAALALYYVVSDLFGSSDDRHAQHRPREEEDEVEPLPPPVQLGEITDEELKQYDGTDQKKPLLMAIKGQIYDVSQSRMFYGPGGPYALFAGKDASRALAKMSFDEKDLNGDLTGLGMFELDALRDWEYKFMSKYVKVGTLKKTEQVNDRAVDGQEEASAPPQSDESKPEETANNDAEQPKEDEQVNAHSGEAEKNE